MMIEDPKAQRLRNLRNACCLVIGFTFGVLLNYYGVIFENIHVTVDITHHKETLNSRESEIIRGSIENSGSLATSSSQYVVPNIVHYIWFTDGEEIELKFLHYLSIVSAYRIQRPTKILFHCNHLPTGLWWHRLWKEVPLHIVYKRPPRSIQGQELQRVSHQGDLAKLEILLEYGGIYLDYDILVVRNLDPLRIYDATLGKEQQPEFISGIIIAKPNAQFIRLMYESYKSKYSPMDWDYNCAKVAFEVYEQRPDLLHVELTGLTAPNLKDPRLLLKDSTNWQGLFVFHVSLVRHEISDLYDPDSIKTLNGTIGEVTRFILNGSPK